MKTLLKYKHELINIFGLANCISIMFIYSPIKIQFFIAGCLIGGLGLTLYIYFTIIKKYKTIIKMQDLMLEVFQTELAKYENKEE